MKMTYGILGIALVGFGTWAAVGFSKKNSDKFPANKSMEVVSNNVSPGAFEPVAVIELFTSQGCSSCPSADKLLAKTIENAGGKKIYALSFHVDYWNRLGWADPFSSAAFSQRQGAYASSLNTSGSYTPQMVVNGRSEFVGSDEGSLNRSLKNALAAKTTAAFTKLNILRSGDPLKVEYEVEGAFQGKVIHFALVSLHESTVVKRGENGGRTLSNDNIVRQFKSVKASSAGTIEFSQSPMPADANLSVIAYVQEGETGNILGAAAVR